MGMWPFSAAFAPKKPVDKPAPSAKNALNAKRPAGGTVSPNDAMTTKAPRKTSVTAPNMTPAIGTQLGGSGGGGGSDTPSRPRSRSLIMIAPAYSGAAL